MTLFPHMRVREVTRGTFDAIDMRLAATTPRDGFWMALKLHCESTRRPFVVGRRVSAWKWAGPEA